MLPEEDNQIKDQVSQKMNYDHTMSRLTKLSEDDALPINFDNNGGQASL